MVFNWRPLPDFCSRQLKVDYLVWQGIDRRVDGRKCGKKDKWKGLLKAGISIGRQSTLRGTKLSNVSGVVEKLQNRYEGKKSLNKYSVLLNLIKITRNKKRTWRHMLRIWSRTALDWILLHQFSRIRSKRESWYRQTNAKGTAPLFDQFIQFLRRHPHGNMSQKLLLRNIRGKKNEKHRFKKGKYRGSGMIWDSNKIKKA